MVLCLLLSAVQTAFPVSNMTSPVAMAARNAIFRSVVWLNGTLPSDWLWKYDCKAVVEADGS